MQVDVALVFVMPVVFLILMKVDPMSVFVPVGSSLLAASFVFAQSVQTFMVSMIFVLVTHPYDEGDTVVINDSGYKVDHISVFSTAFVFTASKMRVYIPHTVYVLVPVAVDREWVPCLSPPPTARLATQSIFNCTRSNHAQVMASVYVDPQVTQQQLAAVKDRVTKYMRTESKEDWLQPADPYFIAGDVRVRTATTCLRWRRRKRVAHVLCAIDHLTSSPTTARCASRCLELPGCHGERVVLFSRCSPA